MKKCQKHISAVALKLDELMDTTFYELGTEFECLVCAREKSEAEAKAKKSADDFEEALATFLITNTGAERKKRAIDIFLSS